MYRQNEKHKIGLYLSWTFRIAGGDYSGNEDLFILDHWKKQFTQQNDLFCHENVMKNCTPSASGITEDMHVHLVSLRSAALI